MPSPVPCLWFDGQGLAAARRYVSLFPNSAVTGTSPGPGGDPLTVSFTLDGREHTALNGGPQFQHSEAFSFQITCADQAEVDHYWDGLLEGGGQEGRCGWLKDPWGVSWQVVPTRLAELLADPDPDRSGRALQAVFGMSRLVVAELEAAADGTA